LKVDDQFNLQVASHTFLGVHLKKNEKKTKPFILRCFRITDEENRRTDFLSCAIIIIIIFYCE